MILFIVCRRTNAAQMAGAVDVGVGNANKRERAKDEGVHNFVI